MSKRIPQGAGRGKLRLRDGLPTGEMRCGDGRRVAAWLRALPRALRGTIGDAGFGAALARDPPPPGSPRPRIPGAVDGEYDLSPRSSCLGGKVALTGGERPELSAGGRALGRLRYRDGQLSGRLTCRAGGAAAVTGAAADRKLTLTLSAAGAPRRGRASGSPL